MDELIPTFYNKRIYQLTREDNFQSWKQQVMLDVRGLTIRIVPAPMPSLPSSMQSVSTLTASISNTNAIDISSQANLTTTTSATAVDKAWYTDS